MTAFFSRAPVCLFDRARGLGQGPRRAAHLKLDVYLYGIAGKNAKNSGPYEHLTALRLIPTIAHETGLDARTVEDLLAKANEEASEGVDGDNDHRIFQSVYEGNNHIELLPADRGGRAWFKIYHWFRDADLPWQLKIAHWFVRGSYAGEGTYAVNMFGNKGRSIERFCPVSVKEYVEQGILPAGLNRRERERYLYRIIHDICHVLVKHGLWKPVTECHHDYEKGKGCPAFVEINDDVVLTDEQIREIILELLWLMSLSHELHKKLVDSKRKGLRGSASRLAYDADVQAELGWADHWRRLNPKPAHASESVPALEPAPVPESRPELAPVVATATKPAPAPAEAAPTEDARPTAAIKAIDRIRAAPKNASMEDKFRAVWALTKSLESHYGYEPYKWLDGNSIAKEDVWAVIRQAHRSVSSAEIVAQMASLVDSAAAKSGPRKLHYLLNSTEQAAANWMWVLRNAEYEVFREIDREGRKGWSAVSARGGGGSEVSHIQGMGILTHKCGGDCHQYVSPLRQYYYHQALLDAGKAHIKQCRIANRQTMAELYIAEYDAGIRDSIPDIQPPTWYLEDNDALGLAA